jgi:hypothetical protein
MRSDHSKLRLGVVTLLAVIVATPAGGCGDTSSAERIAAVEGSPATGSQLTDWFGAFAPSTLAETVRPTDDSPDLSPCVVQKRNVLAAGKQRAATGASRAPAGSTGSLQNNPTDRDLRRQCAAELELAKAETLGFLIRSKWIRREAGRRRLTLTPAEADRAIDERRSQFPTAKDFARYLADSGMTAAQFDWRVRRDALARKLMLAVASPDLSVSPADVARFHRGHASEFDQPRTRELRTVITRSRPSAERARAALESGRRWSTVVRKYSIDPSRRTGGRVPIDTRNVLRGLRTAVFSADLGHLVGPLSVKGVWWVFEVERDRPARRLTLAEATPRIRTIIRSTREQLGLDRLTAYLTRRYRPHTICEPGHTAPECGPRRPPA